MRKGPGDARSFTPQKGCDKPIVNMPGSDHEWRDSIVRVVGPWEAPAEGANSLEHWTGPTRGRVGFSSGPGEGPEALRSVLQYSELELVIRSGQVRGAPDGPEPPASAGDEAAMDPLVEEEAKSLSGNNSLEPVMRPRKHPSREGKLKRGRASSPSRPSGRDQVGVHCDFAFEFRQVLTFV